LYENILVEKTDGVGVIQLNRPQALNALNSGLMQELASAVVAHDADPSIGCHIITGSEKAFAAGADIKDMALASAVDMLHQEFAVWAHVAALKKPVIAVVSGVCLGGGCELALACDMIIASETARFGQPEINLGVIPGGGGTQRLTRAVGKYIAMEMILNNRWLDAAEAKQFGLVNHVFPVATYLDEAKRIAGEIAKRAPVAVRLGKEAVNTAFESSLAEGLQHERQAFRFLFGTEDQKEGMDAFINKRQPTWKGR
jgi:enoyl-CoA hydratase